LTADLIATAGLRVTVAHAPMIGAKDFDLSFAEQTLEDIVAAAIARGAVAERFWWHGRITVDGYLVPPQYWHLARPKRGRHIHLWIPPGDPVSLGVGLGSILFSIGAPVAVVNAAVTFGGSLLLAGIGIVGQLAVNALFTPPQAALRDQSDVAQANRAGITQNVPRKGQSYPFVFGTARVSPQPLCYAWSELTGDDEYAHTVLALAGPHSISDVRVKGVPVAGDDSVETWIDDGTAATRTNQFTRAGYTAPVNRELPQHDARVNEDGFTNLALRDQTNPENSLPAWQRVVSRRNADRVDLRITIRNPFDAGAGNVNQAIWFRLRARKAGESTWKNVGTLPYIGKGQGDFRRRIRFHFTRYSSATETGKSPNGFLQPAATLPAVTSDHAVIKTSDGERFPPAYTFRHRRQAEGIDIYPDDDASEAYFTAADTEYEFELQRSEMVEASELTDVPTMENGGTYYDFFDARDIGSGIWGLSENPEDQGDQVFLESAVSLFDMDIVPPNSSFATLHLRVRNKELSEIDCLASALVPVWNGSVFTGQSASSNPADHFRDVLAGARTVAPVPDANVKDETLGEWREECAARGYAVNLAYYGGTVGEALRLVAACGYARPLEGTSYSVAYHRDTSGERPVQHFTPRNIRNYSWSVAFSPRPGAVLAKFQNAAKNFEPDEIVVEDPYAVAGATGEIEEVEFPGFTTAAEVTARAEFDFLQLRRNIRHRFEVGFEWLSEETEPGNVALLSHDALHRQAAWGRVAAVTNATSFTIDADIGYSADGAWFTADDFFTSADFFEGEHWGIAIRSEDTGEVIVMALDGWTSASRTVTVGDTGDISPGDLCTFGPLEQVTRRVLILEVTPQGDDVAEVVCQDEGNDPDSYFDGIRILAGDQSGKRILAGDQAGYRLYRE
tara:strand:- start:113787 stop:116495 length:2709 start_codon:yes stop_codon:yes gene_type:complete